MANPTITARSAPSGKKLRDGFRSLVAFARDPDVSLWERSVKAPGVSGGDPIDQTTMHNDDVMTKAPQSLIEWTNGSMVCGYDPAVLGQILQLVNKEGSITVHWPDGSTLAFYGYLGTFDVQEKSKGAMPLANCEIVVTNWDPVNDVEVKPLLTSVAGT
jgi:hypothetical protein